MAGVYIRKARSEPRRHMMPGVGAGMVLLTKQDFDSLRSHALLPSAELPCPLPLGTGVCNRLAQGGSLSAPSTCTSAPSGSVRTRRSFPNVERHVRSASVRRPPQPPPPSQPVKQDQVQRKQGEASVPEVGSARRHAADTGAVRKVDRCPPLRKVSSVKEVLSLQGGPLAGGGSSRRARSEQREPPSFFAGLGEQLGICGVDPRRLARPADLLGPMVSGKGLGPQEKQCKPVAESSDREARPGLFGLGLQVSGLPPPMCSSSAEPTEVADAIDWEAKDWSSSEDEEDHSACSEGDGATFNYREYRYHRSQDSRARVAAPEQHRRGRLLRRPRPSSQARDASSDSDTQPWAHGKSPQRWTCDAYAIPSASSCAGLPPSRGSTPFCDEEESPDDELCLVGEVLVKFYGLHGGRERALRLKNNLVIVRDEAWAGKKRASQLTEPPIVWVRGSRVYDFLGDRGTIAEFSHDLLQRQVEDDAICRMRRREQGLMPYPFLAVPLKRDEDGEEQADLARDGGAGNAGRNLGKAGVWR